MLTLRALRGMETTLLKDNKCSLPTAFVADIASVLNETVVRYRSGVMGMVRVLFVGRQASRCGRRAMMLGSRLGLPPSTHNRHVKG